MKNNDYPYIPIYLIVDILKILTMVLSIFIVVSFLAGIFNVVVKREYMVGIKYIFSSFVVSLLVYQYEKMLSYYRCLKEGKEKE